MLDTLRYRDFRLILIATVLATSSRWMEQVAAAWLVLQLTDSPLLVGVAMAFRTVGWLLGPLGGIAVDRMDGRRLLILTQSANLFQAAIMLGLIWRGDVQVWEILTLAFISGIAAAMDWPVRTIVMADLVEKPLLVNAVAFNRMAQDVTQIAGPLLSGSFIALFDFRGAYGLIVAVNIANVALTVLARSPSRSVPTGSLSVWKELREGVGHIRTNRSAQGILLLAAAANFVGFTFGQTLLPVMARDVFKTGPMGLGLLMTALGIGALIASLAVASRHNWQGKGAVMLISFLAWPAMLAALSVSPWYATSFVILLATGAVQSLTMTTTTSLLLTCIPEEMKGRVMGVRALMIATLPLGNLMTGAGANFLGPRWATGANAAILGAIVLSVALAYRGLRELR